MNTLILWNIELITNWIEIFLCCVFCDTYLKRKFEDKHLKLEITGSIGAAIIMLVSNYINFFSGAVVIINTCIVVFWLFFIYNEKIWKILATSAIYVCILFTVSVIVPDIYGTLFNVDINKYLQGINSQRIGLLFAVHIFLVIIVFIVKKYITINTLREKYWKILFVICSITIIMFILITQFLLSNGTSYKVKVFTLAFFFVGVVQIVTVIAIIIKMQDLYEKRSDQNTLILKNQMLEQMITDGKSTLDIWRRNQHDLKNHLLGMKILVKQKSYDKLESYIDDLLKQVVEKNYVYITGNTIVDAIINQKYFIAKYNNIVFSVSATIPKQVHISDTDWCSILGNALDNALESTTKCSEKIIRIIMKQEKNFYVIKIQNSVDSNPFTNNENLQTTKENKKYHGIGIKSIKMAVDKYEGNMKYFYEGDSFILQILFNMDNVNKN